MANFSTVSNVSTGYKDVIARRPQSYPTTVVSYQYVSSAFRDQVKLRRCLKCSKKELINPGSVSILIEPMYDSFFEV